MQGAVLPVIPETITVHLGDADENARNVTVSFVDYIANVASSEIYPTWPEEALKANILAETSFALNRIYTEFYRSRGYDFDITATTTQDQAFVYGREIFENINDLVGDMFNSYVKRDGAVEPLFTAYCDGDRVTCEGLSQWGSVRLAENGLSYDQILRRYYGNDIEIVTDVPITGVFNTAPTIPLKIGQVNDNVRFAQIRLNRISDNFPNIPKIPSPDGIFDYATEDATKEFQKTFGLTPDGIIGNATWYRILQVYAAVKRLNEITSEGVSIEEVTKQFPNEIQRGDRGIIVLTLQYYVSYLSEFFDTIPEIESDGIFGEETENAVKDLQNTFGLPPTGIVDEITWNVLYNNYLGIVGTIPVEYTEGVTIPFGGVILRFGSTSDSVRVLQEYLNYIAMFFTSIPSVTPTGYFGRQTEKSVTAFQEEFGLPENGIVGIVTWDAIADLYEDLYLGTRYNDGQYPGVQIGA